MPAVSDAELVRRARAAIAVGDMDTAKRAAAELWARHQRQAFLASRSVAAGDERDEVLGHIGIRFTRWVYHGKDEPRNMAGLISQMAHYAAGDVTRKEAGEAPTIDDIDAKGDAGGDPLRHDGDVGFDHLLDVDQIERLRVVLDEREQTLVDLQLQEVPDAEIAEAIGVKANNLHQIRFRMMEKLRREARRQDDDAEVEG